MQKIRSTFRSPRLRQNLAHSHSPAISGGSFCGRAVEALRRQRGWSRRHLHATRSASHHRNARVRTSWYAPLFFYHYHILLIIMHTYMIMILGVLSNWTSQNAIRCIKSQCHKSRFCTQNYVNMDARWSYFREGCLCWETVTFEILVVFSGAIHSVVFGGFAAKELSTRIQHAKVCWAFHQVHLLTSVQRLLNGSARFFVGIPIPLKGNHAHLQGNWEGSSWVVMKFEFLKKFRY